MNNSQNLQQKAASILEMVKKADKILLHCHPSPDQDSLGSVLATKFALEQMGKQVTAIKGDSDLPRAFSSFPGYNSVVQKNFSEINLADFDLFIILDAAGPEQISRYASVVFPMSIPTVVIDHHKTNPQLATENLVDASYPATAQLLYDIFKIWNITLNHDIAINLFMGIYGDTGGFKYAGTTPQTFLAAAEMVALAPDYSKVISEIENSNTPIQLAFQALTINSIKTFAGGKVAIAALSTEALKQAGIPAKDVRVGLVSSLLRSVIGYDVCAVIAEPEPGAVRISFRTRDAEKYDVSALAQAVGGGGHKAAAGAVMKCGLDEAVQTVVAKAKELYNLEA